MKDQTPIQEAIGQVKKCMAPGYENEWNMAYGVVVRILESLLPKEREFVRDNFRTGYNLSQHKQGLIGMEQPTLTEYLNQLYPKS